MVTGHRPNVLGGHDPNNPQRLYIKKHMTGIMKFILNKYPDVEGISGMALGADQDFCDVCISLNIPFLAYVPFKKQESMWPDSSKSYYSQLLEKAKEIKIISTGEYSPKKMQIRNMAMSDDCNISIGVWNNSISGGTANCIKYLKQIEKPIVQIDPNLYTLDSPPFIIQTSNKVTTKKTWDYTK